MKTIVLANIQTPANITVYYLNDVTFSSPSERLTALVGIIR